MTNEFTNKVTCCRGRHNYKTIFNKVSSVCKCYICQGFSIDEKFIYDLIINIVYEQCYNILIACMLIEKK